MRLIDANALMECIDKNCDDSFAGMLKALVRRQPTAFDKESVIEDLEALEETESLNMNDDVAMAYAYALAIVEKGGIE